MNEPTNTETTHYYVDGAHMGEREIAAESRAAAAQQYAEVMCLRTDPDCDPEAPIRLRVAETGAVDAVRTGEPDAEDHLWTEEVVS